MVTLFLSSARIDPFSRAAADSLIQVEFTPDIPPLFMPTVPPQPFETNTVDQADQQNFPLGHEDELLRQGIPDDEDALGWIAFIEARWDNVDIISCEAGEYMENCTQWTAQEARLLYETFGTKMTIKLCTRYTQLLDV